MNIVIINPNIFCKVYQNVVEYLFFYHKLQKNVLD